MLGLCLDKELRSSVLQLFFTSSNDLILFMCFFGELKVSFHLQSAISHWLFNICFFLGKNSDISVGMKSYQRSCMNLHEPLFICQVLEDASVFLKYKILTERKYVSWCNPGA